MRPRSPKNHGVNEGLRGPDVLDAVYGLGFRVQGLCFPKFRRVLAVIAVADLTLDGGYLAPFLVQTELGFPKIRGHPYNQGSN